MEKAIKFHAQADNPDRIAIEQYTELQERYQTELAEILQTYGVKVLLPQVA